MILALDHIVLLARDLGPAIAAHQLLLGVAPAWRAKGGGSESALFTLGNVTLEILAPSADAGGERIRAALEAQGEGLASLAFQVDDVARFHRRLNRLALDPEDISFGESRDEASGAMLSWKRTRAATARTHGVRLFFLELERVRPLSAPLTAAPVTAIDHIVVSTPDAERAAALYGARLDLDMALDQRGAGDQTALMFFRCGDMIVEVLREDREGPDKLWGISWRVADIDAAHARLAREGFNISEVRTGRRDGTHVFTVRDAPFGVQTLMIELRR